jgi:hypothetical protein
MAMLQSERLRLIQEEANKYVSRRKVRDASELTYIHQAQALSKTTQPVTVVTKVIRDGCAADTTVCGKGTNKDYTAILQKAQSCAICSEPDLGNNLVAVLPTPCFPRNRPPFAQQDMLGTVYTPPCKPGYQVFFPPKLSDGPTCNFNRQFFPSG